jgi:hypothetical protein
LIFSLFSYYLIIITSLFTDFLEAILQFLNEEFNFRLLHADSACNREVGEVGIILDMAAIIRKAEAESQGRGLRRHNPVAHDLATVEEGAEPSGTITGEGQD